MLIDYDKSPHISPEQRIRSLADSVMRAMEELEVNIKDTDPKAITLEDLGAYPKTGGTIEGDVSVRGNKVTLFGEATEEGFIVSGGKPTTLNDLTVQGEANIATDEEFQSVWKATFGSAISTKANLKNMLKNIAYKLGLIADYIVEYGTSGNWKYEKWASGKAEAWYQKTSNINFNLTAAFGYYTSWGINFPSGLFTTAPIVIGNLHNNYAGFLSCSSWDTTSLTAYLICETKATVATTLSVRATGTWK